MSLNFLPLQRMLQAIIAPDSMISQAREMKFAFTSGHNRSPSSPRPKSKSRNLNPIARPITVSNAPKTSEIHVSPPSNTIVELPTPVQNRKGKNRDIAPYSSPSSPTSAHLKPIEDPPPYELEVPGASEKSEPGLAMSDIDYAITLQIEEIETINETFADEEMARTFDAGIDITPRLPFMRYNLRPRQPRNAGSSAPAKPKKSIRRVIHECTSCFDKIQHLNGLRSACGHHYCLTCVRNMVDISLKGDAASFPPKCCNKPLMGASKGKIDGDAQIELLGLFLDDLELQEKMKTKWREISVDPMDRAYCSKPGCSEFLGSVMELANDKSEGPSRSAASSSQSTSSFSGAPHFLRRFTSPKVPSPALPVKCPKCRSMTCVVCRQAGHAGQSCSESLDVRFWDLVQVKQWKKCPHCRAVVEKNGGCSNVVCRCGKAFTY